MKTISEIKIILIAIKAKIFNLSDKEIENLVELGFKSRFEEGILIVLKSKWHDMSWLFGAVASTLGIIYIVKKIFS